MAATMPKGKAISRVPTTPRIIRDIRPARQLPRGGRTQADDDWWYQANQDEGKEPSVAAAHLRGIASANEFRSRSGFSQKPVEPRESVETDDIENDGDVKNRGVVKSPVLPSKRVSCRKKIKRLLGISIFIALMHKLYFLDLESYSWPKQEKKSIDDSSPYKPSVNVKPFGKTLDVIASNIKHGTSVDSGSRKMTTSDSAALAMNMGTADGFRKASKNPPSERVPKPLPSWQQAQPSSSSSMPKIDVKSIEYPPDRDATKLTAYSEKNDINQYTSQYPDTSFRQGLLDKKPFMNEAVAQSKDSRQQYVQQQTSSLFQQSRNIATIKNKSQERPVQQHSSELRGRNVASPGQMQQLANSWRSHNSASQNTIVQTLGYGSNGSRKGVGNGIAPPTNSISYTDYGKNTNDLVVTTQDISNEQTQNIEKTTNAKPLAGLHCTDHGGPFSDADTSELVYWRDLPPDAAFTSHYYTPQESGHEYNGVKTSFWKPKYLTFEMDDSGWNNARLGLENVILLAHAMGRTLVMPPKRQIAHMVDKSLGRVFSFDDFFDMDTISAEQEGLNIITMEEFLEREALSNHLKSLSTGEPLSPPNNLTKWDNERLGPLWDYIRSVAKSFEWKPAECVLALHSENSNVMNLAKLMGDILVGQDGRPFPWPGEFQGKPTRTDAPPIERLREILAGRRKICMYDDNMHLENDVLHFKADENDGTRLITQFYAFIWFEDWRQDLWAKRFIRDHLRYRDEIMCLAARVIKALRNYAKEHSPSNVDGAYDAVHIRRGDFQSQFPQTRMTATEILEELQEYLTPNRTLFVATDERDKSFFRPIEKVFDVRYLADFAGLLSGTNPNYFGLVEQIVASRSHIFFGTHFSSFSSYIVRLRGYFSVKEKHEGYLNGGLQNTYFLPANYKREMRIYQAIHKPFYARDFPIVWRDIDKLELPQI